MASPTYHKIRRKLLATGILPLGGLARFTLYLLGLDLFLFVVARLSAWIRHRPSVSLDAWVSFLTSIAGTLLVWLIVRWGLRRAMWRLRNRLIVTYTFIGVIPVLLLIVMGLIIAYLFVGQFATYVATSDLKVELKSLEALNEHLASEVAAPLREGKKLSRGLLQKVNVREEAFPERSLSALYRGNGEVLESAAELNGKVANTTDSQLVSPPQKIQGDVTSLVIDRERVWLRSMRTLSVGDEKLIVISSVPLNKTLLEKLAADIGSISLVPFKISGPQSSGRRTERIERLRINESNEELRIGPEGGVEAPGGGGQGITAGKLPPPLYSLDREVTFPTTLTLLDWQSGESRNALMLVRTRPSLLYQRLFLVIGQFANAILIALVAVAIAFAVIELVALLIGIGLSRTITRSVAALYRATQFVNRGDFSHRIQVKSDDQLAALEKSFNGMAESLEKLIAEQKEKQRMENELAIAQEVQAQLFPKQASDLATLELYGVCRPARTVSGDYYDFIPLGPEKVALAVGDISGKGISAALLMATIHSAVRAYSLERSPALAAANVGGGVRVFSRYDASSFGDSEADVSPALLCTMLNRQLYQSTPLEKYATMFLGVYDGQTRKLTHTNAGHLAPLVLSRDGRVRRLDTGGTVIGLLDGVSYQEATAELRPDDIFVAYSDGVTEPENEFGEFGEHRLIQLVQENHNLPIARISELALAAVSDWIGPHEQPDDVTLVLARVR
ncbi:MAG TPA: SpoIIE family protein phosphatase [Terriglobales bacterium]|nr:SpoIIE family protein phosphatase [Terriglobales bacterium]